MGLLPTLTLWLQDREGNERSTRLTFPSLVSVPQAVALANAAGDVVVALTNARLSRAQWTLTVPPSVPTAATPQTNIYERLIVLFTNGVAVASFSLPAPRPGAYDTNGSLRDVRVQEGPNPVAQAINQLQAVLAGSLLPDGSPFPAGEWVAGRTQNQCDGE